VRVGVLTLTRDRLAYTQHCFATLRENAGLEFDWFVLDQGSTDGTSTWLLDQDDLNVTLLSHNIGICRGLNLLLDEAVNPSDYDLVVRFDNDCEVLYPDTLKTVGEVALAHNAILAPHVHGLNSPPTTLETVTVGDSTIDRVHHLGGIFMAIPAALFVDHEYRYDERNPLCGGDEMICPWWAARGGLVGYLAGAEVNHYETTDGQKLRFPAYWDRKVAEMA